VTTTDVLLLADTHLGPGQADRLLSRIATELAPADLVLHAGDVTDASVLDALAARLPDGRVYAVNGNNDHGLHLPDRLVLDVHGCAVALVHDSGPAAGRAHRLRRWFPDADAVVFGHSHLPWHEVDVRPVDGHVQHQVNPGSAMLRRRAPACTVAHLLVRAGRVEAVQHVEVGPSP